VTISFSFFLTIIPVSQGITQRSTRVFRIFTFCILKEVYKPDPEKFAPLAGDKLPEITYNYAIAS
jgi:hypothetical protein